MRNNLETFHVIKYERCKKLYCEKRFEKFPEKA